MLDSISEEISFDNESFISKAPEDQFIESEDNELDLEKLTISEKNVPIFDSYEKAKFFKIENELMNLFLDEFAKKTPFELFLFFFGDICKQISEYTNKYILENNETDLNFDANDILLYLFVYIYLSVYNLPEIWMLWENSIFFKSIIPRILSKNKYNLINKYFTISNLTKLEESQKSEKILPIINYLNIKWKEAYPYTKYLSIDEAMTSYKGEIYFRQYMKDKHKRFGIKLFSKASADKGYCYHMMLYTGKNFEFDKKYGIGTSVIKELTKDHVFQNYHFTFDNYFSNLYTFLYLEQNKLNFTCTFSLNRKALPQKIKNVNLKKKKIKYYILDNTNITFFIYHDSKKQIQLASNCSEIQYCKYKNKSGKRQYKHEIVAKYNLTKSGVDLIDSATQIYKTQRKTNKWWKAVFFYLLDVTMNNCSIIYRTSEKYHKISYKNKALFFRKILINEILEYFKAKEIKMSYKLIKEYHLLVESGMKVKSCQNCKEMKKSNGKNYRRSKFKCNKCNKILCKECFISTHINMNMNLNFDNNNI